MFIVPYCLFLWSSYYVVSYDVNYVFIEFFRLVVSTCQVIKLGKY